MASIQSEELVKLYNRWRTEMSANAEFGLDGMRRG